MTGTFKVGAGSGGSDYIKYLLSKALEAGQQLDAAARYYAGQAVEPELSPMDALGKSVHDGDIGFEEALSDLIRAEIRLQPDGQDFDIDALEDRVLRQLEAATTRADFAEAGISLGSAARLRPDLDPALAKRLGIDTNRPLTVGEMANLMDNKTAAGLAIEGKKKHSAHRSVADTFGLDKKQLPSADAVRNVLAGKRVDGTAPVAANGKNKIKPATIESSVRKFKAAMGIPATRDATEAEIQNVADGRFDQKEYYKQIAATAQPVGYVDVVWNADKSFSSAFALAPTDHEAQLIRSIIADANADAMAYLEGRIGVARSGGGGKGPAESAKLLWISTEHVDARPTIDVVRIDAKGREFSQQYEIPGNVDPHLHHHNVVPSAILTKSGRIASLNLDLLDGEIKVFGAVGHAALATHARKHGMDVVMGPNGEARLTAVSEDLRRFHSRRTTEGTKAAQDLAKQRGKKPWDELKPAEQIALLNEGVASKRRDKETPAANIDPADRTTWLRDAEQAGFRHRSVLRPNATVVELSPEQRIEVAREAALPLLEKAFQTRSVLKLGEVREIAARGLITSGMGPDPAADIAAVAKTFKDRGVRVNGEMTDLIQVVTHGKDGRREVTLTTGRAVEMEENLITLVRTAAVDKSTALSPAQIDQAADRFLAKHPKIDPTGAQWKAQLAMAHQIGEGGRLSLSIGVAGSGKTSSVVATLVDAWHQDGRTVYGMTVPWKASAALRDAGVDHAVAIEAFIKRVEKGQYKLDSNSVIVADEVSQIGIRHQTALMELAAKHGAQLVEIGDPKQCASVETPALDLMAKTIGDANIPKLLTTIRQQTERDRDVATMFRNGQAADGIAAMQEDNRFHLVAGGADAAVKHTTALWRTLTDAHATDPDYSLLVMAPTNAQALTISKAIRADRQQAGEIGKAETTIKAKDPNSGQAFDLAISVGDKVRMFTRTYDADTPGRQKYLSSNGDVVEIKAVLADGLRIRNADGEEGRITWAQMKPWRAPKNDPVLVTLGYAVTVDTAQSLTQSAAIVALTEESSQLSGNKAYTGFSRHIQEAHLVVSDAAERRAIVNRQRIGLNETPRQEDVVRNIATNLSRFAVREQATDLLSRAVQVHRGAVKSFHKGSEAVERKTKTQRTRTYFERSQVVNKFHHVVDHAQQVARQLLVQAQSHRYSNGPSLGR